MVRGLLRLIDDFEIARSQAFDRRTKARSAARMRHTILAKGFDHALAATLKGDRGDRIVYSDDDLRRHALQCVIRSFNDDLQWCREVAHSIYLLDPPSIAEIDSIIEAHVESRAGAFAPAFYTGRG